MAAEPTSRPCSADGRPVRRHVAELGRGLGPGALRPHALRGPDRRLADRGGDEGRPRSGRRSPGSSTTGSSRASRSASTPPPATRPSSPGRDRDDIDFESDSPYNTRRKQGLPPTPIASPGRASSRRRSTRPTGPWIYYVLEDAEGHHFFTDSAASSATPRSAALTPGSAAGDGEPVTGDLGDHPRGRRHRSARSGTRCRRRSTTPRSRPAGSTGSTSRSRCPRAPPGLAMAGMRALGLEGCR